MEEDEETVEPVSVAEVLPNQAGEGTGRLSFGARLLAHEGEASELLLVPGGQLFLGLTRHLGAEFGVWLSVSPRATTAAVSRASAGLKFVILHPEQRVPGVVIQLEASPIDEEGAQVGLSLGSVYTLQRFHPAGLAGNLDAAF